MKLLTAFLLLLSTGIHAQKADDVIGIWMSESGKAKVEIFKTSEKYYGKIVWLKNPLDETGQPKTDKNNPEIEKKGRKLLGLLMLKSFVFVKNEWTNGTIYDPENGKEYDCKITMNADGSLNIRGYVGISLLGRTTVWKRSE